MWRDWCRACGEFVEPEAGVLDQGVRHRPGECPTPLPFPTWRLRRRDHAYEPGQTLRVRFVPSAARGELRPRPDIPGYRVLDDDGLVEAIVTVVQCRSSGGHHYARVRAATPEEATEILARDAAILLEVRPVAAGFKAQWSAERIGPSAIRGAGHWLAPSPWLAELIGYSAAFGFRRDFLEPHRDYSRGNGRGTRGVMYHWTLTVNRVYEAYRKTGVNTAERMFLRATSDGDVEQISREEVEAWLREGSELMFIPPRSDG
jgi:hypothetical protein